MITPSIRSRPTPPSDRFLPRVSGTPSGLPRVFLVAAGLAVAFSPLVAQSLDTGLSAGANAEVLAVAVQPDGKILIGGNFSTVGGQARSRLARFNVDGTLDAAFNPGADGSVTALLVQPDGRILVGGTFTTIGPALAARSRLARLNGNGTVDPSFLQGANQRVAAFALQGDGKVIVAGSFTQLAGAPRTGLGRLNPDGSLDAAFHPTVAGTLTGSNVSVEALLWLASGRILVGGNFSSLNGQSSAGAGRLHTDGTRDATFNPAANSEVLAFAALPDGRFYMGGAFSRLGGELRPYVARFNADGSLDPAVPPPPNSTVRGIVVQSDGRVVIGGNFSEVGPVRRSRIARYLADTSLDLEFFADVGGSLGSLLPGIYRLALTGADQIVAGGAFSSVAGSERNGIARFGSPLPAIRSSPRDVYGSLGAAVTLSVAATGENIQIQWKRDGVDVPGGTAATLLLPSLQSRDTGNYTVAISNAYGTLVSPPARVALGAPPATTYTVTTVAGAPGEFGYVQATGSNARFQSPIGIAVNSSGTLFVTDTPNNAIREISPLGFAGTLAGITGWGIALGPTGELFVTDVINARIARVTRSGALTTYAGGTTSGTEDGPRLTAKFRGPRGVAVDSTGAVYVADTDNYTIRRISPAGIVTTIAGQPGARGVVDGVGSAARFDGPWGLTLDREGDLLVADRGVIRKVTPNGVVTTVVPPGVFVDATGIAVDGAGNIYVSDAARFTVRRVSPTGENTIIAGAHNQQGELDGPGTFARFGRPWSLAIDSAGNLFVADNRNSTIRKVSPSATYLAITKPPGAAHAVAGGAAQVSVSASGTGLAYQWKKDGAPIPGATSPVYRVSGASSAAMGFYSVVVGSGGSAIESTPALFTVETPGTTTRLVNVATRGFVSPGGALTPGFVLRGTGGKTLLVRAIGPTLLNFGVGGHLPDPRFELAPWGAPARFANDDWGAGGLSLVTPTAAAGAFSLSAGSKDAAALVQVDLASHQAYTVNVTGHDAVTSGVALAEVYDVEPLDASAQLANVSTRGFVGTGERTLVPGFVISGTSSLQILVRVVGPGLEPFGVPDVLADPQIVVLPLGGTTPVAANNDWGGTPALREAFARAGAFPLADGSKDAAVLVHLAPGAYTVTVSGVGNTTGTAVVEVYDVR